MQLWNCNNEPGGERTWVKTHAQSRMVLTCAAACEFLHVYCSIFGLQFSLVQIMRIHAGKKQVKYSGNVSFGQRSNEGKSRRKTKKILYFIRENTYYCA